MWTRSAMRTGRSFGLGTFGTWTRGAASRLLLRGRGGSITTGGTGGDASMTPVISAAGESGSTRFFTSSSISRGEGAGADGGSMPATSGGAAASAFGGGTRLMTSGAALKSAWTSAAISGGASVGTSVESRSSGGTATCAAMPRERKVSRVSKEFCSASSSSTCRIERGRRAERVP